MKKITLFTCFFAFVSAIGYAQKTDDWCGSDYFMEKQIQQIPALKNWKKIHDAQIRQIVEQNKFNPKSRASCHTSDVIPVVVHIIHDNGIGDISDAQVKDGIKVLNEDFKRVNADTGETRDIFKPYVSVPEFEFRLAQIDPSGASSTGIVRVNSTESNNADDGVKSVSYWSSSQYFNVWLVNTIGGGGGGGITLGYAQFPGFGSWNTYGTVIRSDRWGRIGTSGGDGRTATHEVGHCLGLYHTFQGGCGGNCSSTGDGICDTPPVATSTQNCDITQNSCSNDTQGGSPFTFDVEDQVENYMSYDNCQNMFTLDQKDVMKGVIQNYSQLQNLVSESNLTAVGVNDLTVADFSPSKVVFCAGELIGYSDDSQHGQCNWDWSFEGGSPATSNEQYPVVRYWNPGLYDVSLSVDNTVVTKSKSIADYILVVDPSQGFLPFSEDFENTSLPNNNWLIHNPDGDSKMWQHSTTTGYNSSSSAMMNNVNNTSGNMDQLILGGFDLSSISLATFKFKVAFAQRDAADNDILRLYVSPDCGGIWYIRWAKTGSQLATVPAQFPVFTPSSDNDWVEYSVNLSSTLLSESILFKFEFESNGGNNLYIDDINIDGTWNTKPVLKSPVDGTVGQADDVLLDWKAVGAIDLYEWQLDVSNQFNTGSLQTGTTNFISTDPNNSDTEFQTSNLTHSQNYYWRVRTLTSTDTSLWSDTWAFTVSETGVGVDEFDVFPQSETMFNIFPNPSHGVFEVKLTSSTSSSQGGEFRAVVYNVLGEQVHHQIITLTNRLIDISSQPKGIYFVKINTKNKSIVKKIVVN